MMFEYISDQRLAQYSEGRLEDQRRILAESPVSLRSAYNRKQSPGQDRARGNSTQGRLSSGWPFE
jgi:hypothetical protein